METAHSSTRHEARNRSRQRLKSATKRISRLLGSQKHAKPAFPSTLSDHHARFSHSLPDVASPSSNVFEAALLARDAVALTAGQQHVSPHRGPCVPVLGLHPLTLFL